MFSNLIGEWAYTENAHLRVRLEPLKKNQREKWSFRSSARELPRTFRRGRVGLGPAGYRRFKPAVLTWSAAVKKEWPSTPRPGASAESPSRHEFQGHDPGKYFHGPWWLPSPPLLPEQNEQVAASPAPCQEFDGALQV